MQESACASARVLRLLTSSALLEVNHEFCSSLSRHLLVGGTSHTGQAESPSGPRLLLGDASVGGAADRRASQMSKRHCRLGRSPEQYSGGVVPRSYVSPPAVGLAGSPVVFVALSACRHCRLIIS